MKPRLNIPAKMKSPQKLVSNIERLEKLADRILGCQPKAKSDEKLVGIAQEMNQRSGVTNQWLDQLSKQCDVASAILAGFAGIEDQLRRLECDFYSTKKSTASSSDR